MKRKHQWSFSMTTDEFVEAIKKHGISSCSIVIGKYGWIEVRSYNSWLGGRNPNNKNTNSLYLLICQNDNGIKVRGVFGLPAPMLLGAWIALLSFLLAYTKNVGFGLDALLFFVAVFLPMCILASLFKRAIEYGLRNRNETDNQALIHLIGSIGMASTHKKAGSSNIEPT